MSLESPTAAAERARQFAIIAELLTGGARDLVRAGRVDALAEFGVHHIEMPATPERVWHAIRAPAARRM